MGDDGDIVLRPHLLGPVERYALLALHPGRVVVDTGVRYDKREKETHRFLIADTRGPVALTIPVARPASLSSTALAEVLLSGHAPWWTTLMTALESAYGRTPYFEYYADDFAALLHPRRVGEPLLDLQRDLDLLVCRLMQVEPPRYESVGAQSHFVPRPWQGQYWQVRQQRLGFIPGLSVVDMLFSLGPECFLREKRRQS